MYHYGPIAFFWRFLIGAALASGGACAWFAWTSSAPALLVVAAPLVLPALFFGSVVATRIDRETGGDVVVRTLLLTRRSIRRDQLGKPRIRQRAQSESGAMYAPRAWVPVRGGLPVYLDLLARIPDRRAFADFWRIPMSELPRRTA